MTARDIAAALEDVVDPELGLDIVALGLVYAIADRGDDIIVDLTTTSDGCPMGAAIFDMARVIVGLRRPGANVTVREVHEPRWDVRMMTAAARRTLGLPATP